MQRIFSQKEGSYLENVQKLEKYYSLMLRTHHLWRYAHAMDNGLEGEAPETVSKPGNHEGLPLRIVSQYTDTPITLCLRVGVNEF